MHHHFELKNVDIAEHTDEFCLGIILRLVRRGPREIEPADRFAGVGTQYVGKQCTL